VSLVQVEHNVPTLVEQIWFFSPYSLSAYHQMPVPYSIVCKISNSQTSVILKMVAFLGCCTV
jgi:hypothetical protein